MSLLAPPHVLPPWLHQLAEAVDDDGAIARAAADDGPPGRRERSSRADYYRPPAHGGRPAAVLVLFGPMSNQSGDPSVVLIERAHGLRAHAGQVAFPGGAIDPTDPGPVHAALREANEETGVDPSSVLPFATLAPLYLPASGFLTTPVLGWWAQPARVQAGDPGEVASAHQVAVAELAHPANRFMVRHPLGQAGPGFRAGGLFVWGFTAALLDRLLALGGWERAWDRSRQVDLPEVFLGRRP